MSNEQEIHHFFVLENNLHIQNLSVFNYGPGDWTQEKMGTFSYCGTLYIKFYFFPKLMARGVWGAINFKINAPFPIIMLPITRRIACIVHFNRKKCMIFTCMKSRQINLTKPLPFNGYHLKGNLTN